MYKKTIFDNGLCVVTESIPHVKSVSLGIWVNIGSRDEKDSEAGLSHFLEHMLFKGTSTRSALDIAKEFDQVGGMANAFTSKENTCFHARVMSGHLARLTDLLADIFLNSTLASEDIDRERQVILQEISMVEDTPDENVHVLFNQNFWSGDPLGRSVLGMVETVGGFEREDLTQYLKRFYLPSKIVIAAAGDLEHDSFLDLIRPFFEALPSTEDGLVRIPPEVREATCITHKNLEQVHLCLGTPFTTTVDEKRYAGAVLNTLLGGNMSSRLFQEVRENRGLAYSIYSFISNYADAGLLGIYAGVSPEQATEAIELIVAELKKIKRGEVSESEIRSAQEYLKGGIVLSLDNIDNLMIHLAKNEITFGERITYESILTAIDKVTLEQIVELVNIYFGEDSLSLTALGPWRGEEVPEGLLKL
ncbi:MAG: insulinase family protein [Deltaproteobacteria bacterium]|nr:insulinase family protein [Deltaproteobacteria bacterium]